MFVFALDLQGTYVLTAPVKQGSDPGVKISIYWPPVTNYQIPGPSVFTC